MGIMSSNTAKTTSVSRADNEIENVGTVIVLGSSFLAFADAVVWAMSDLGDFYLLQCYDQLEIVSRRTFRVRHTVRNLLQLILFLHNLQIVLLTDPGSLFSFRLHISSAFGNADRFKHLNREEILLSGGRVCRIASEGVGLRL